MAKQSRPQKKTVERVMHEFKHGELKSGPRGRGGKVKNPRQAIAIALHEAGASKYESKRENERNLQRTKRKERKGETALAETEGRKSLPDRRKSMGARKTSGRKTSARSKTKAARKTTARTSSGRKAAGRSKTAAARKSTPRKTSARKSPARKSTRASGKRKASR